MIDRRENRLLRDIYMKITIIISKRLFILFPNLITKESYNWWVTRRFWGFRQQISKAKYLKISQNVGGKYQEASGEHRSTCAKWLLSHPGRRYKRIRICVSGEVWNTLLSHPASCAGCKISEWNVLDARHPGGKWRQPDGMASQPSVMAETAGCYGGDSRV